MNFLTDEIVGAIDDLGSDVLLDDGTPFRGVLRNDYQDENLNDARVEGTRSSLMVAASLVPTLALKKGSGLSVEGGSYVIRRVEPGTSGFYRLVLTAR